MAIYNGYVLTDDGRVLAQTCTSNADLEIWLPASSEFDSAYATIFVCKAKPSEENASVVKPKSWTPIPAGHPEVAKQLTEFQRYRAECAFRETRDWLAAHPTQST